jgi:hypothetical protein
LSDGLEQLDDKYDNLENLTRGTKEWKEAVKEVNAEVLGLIEKYPELAGLVENKNGVLTLDIESKEVQDVLEKYEGKAAQASAASYAAKINVNEKKAVKQGRDISSNNQAHIYDGSSSSGQWVSLSDATTQAMAQAMTSGDLRDENGDGSLTTEMTEWLKNNGTGVEATYAADFAYALQEATDDLKKFGAELDTMNAQDQVMYE